TTRTRPFSTTPTVDDGFEFTPDEARQVDVLKGKLCSRVLEVLREDLARDVVLGAARIVGHELARARDTSAWPIEKIGPALRACHFDEVVWADELTAPVLRYLTRL